MFRESRRLRTDNFRGGSGSGDRGAGGLSIKANTYSAIQAADFLLAEEKSSVQIFFSFDRHRLRLADQG